jgi:hypothetical protein
MKRVPLACLSTHTSLPVGTGSSARPDGIVRATLDAATPDAVRAAIDIDAGKGPRASAIMPVGGTPPTRIVVTASAPGMAPATLEIPLSVDAADVPLAVAAASVALADVTA